RRRRRVRQGRPERAGRRGPAVPADLGNHRGRDAGVRPSPAPCCRGSGFSRELLLATPKREKLAAEAAPTSVWSSVWSGAFVVALEGVVRTLAGCAVVLRQQFLQFAEQLAERARRLVAPALLVR